jgi:hypothetical protein
VFSVLVVIEIDQGPSEDLVAALTDEFGDVSQEAHPRRVRIADRVDADGEFAAIDSVLERLSSIAPLGVEIKEAAAAVA